MARLCKICGRGPLKAVSRSHSNIATKRRQHVNLQSMPVNGQRVRACASCIRTHSRERN